MTSKRIKISLSKKTVSRNFKTTGRFNTKTALVFIILFAVIGCYFIFKSFAASPSVSTITGIAGKCLDNQDNRKTAYNKIQLFSCNGTTAQQWIVNATATAAGTIVNSNGYCLDVHNAGTTSGTKVVLFPCNGTVAQRWLANNSGTIVNPHSGLCLDDKLATTKNGNPIWLYSCNGTNAQKWTIKSDSSATSAASVVVTATPASITSGSASVVSWNATNATSCMASGGWTGTEPISGTYTTSDLSSTTTYTLTCLGSGSSVTADATVTVGEATTPEPLGVPGNWTMEFDDEFTGTTLGSDWNAEGPRLPNNSQELDCYSPSNVSVSGGYLNMALTDTSCTVDGETFPYTGSQIDTNGHFNPTYGYFEARVYAPGSDGEIWNWPAWWMYGPNWPTGGEIDIFEGLDGYAGWHFDHADSGGNSVWQGGVQTGQDFTGWHTYGVDWQPNSITYYYDGVKVGTIISGVTNQPMRLVIDNTTSPVGNQAGPIVVPATIKVDYVRVWQ